ncbi:DUF3298 and DUF4163 domain-containing protein [Alkalicoccobacillus plakortidis]|uniref:DUF3298 and DUF4163 domain-containing protein n=1 Tax=Alkalicoccobacillus plakortidis TaxID=444060 RepID=A0ABT0XNB6_9BACI|nr:DUF3298 and DUF4163 domain-containing protein [Alkalicoccobacillus plakortidis]MCM2676739.1 DUF3298 and DUF4163 domain-containing protein [Alkalicoccobacillus plakortidis]
MNTSILPTQIVTRHMLSPRLDIFYPELTGLPTPHIQHELNQAINQQVHKMIKDSGYYEPPQDTTLTGGYEIKNNQRNILSLMNRLYYYSGGAHGMTVQETLTMNTANGKIYSLGDLFKGGVNYTQPLNKIIEAQIKARQLDLLNPFTGITADQKWYIADKSLVLFFDLYELQAYVYGFTYFPISVYGIQSIIRDDGPLGEMIY